MYDELSPNWTSTIQSLLKGLIYCNLEKIDLNFRVYTISDSGDEFLFKFDQEQKTPETKESLYLRKSWSGLSAWENLSEKEKQSLITLANSKKCEIRDRNFDSSDTFVFVFVF
jgi:hypothetical protein